MTISTLQKIMVVCLISSVICLDLGSQVGGRDEKGFSVKDFTSRKSGSEYVAQDEGRNAKEDSSESEKKIAESHEEKQNSGHYDEHDSVKKGHEVGRQAEGDSHKIDQGEHAVEKHNNGQEKKGYHRSGFVNKYHKDESGDNSSFYEDSDNQSGHNGYAGRSGQFHERAGDSYKKGVHDSALAAKDKVDRGVYDKGERFNDRYNYAGGHDNTRYDDDRKKIYHDGAGRYFDHNGNEIFYYNREQPSYYPNEYYHHGQYGYPHYNAYYPRDHYIRYYPDQPDYHKSELYYPEGRKHYDGTRDTWADYYRDAYNTGYREGYLPNGAQHQEYYGSY